MVSDADIKVIKVPFWLWAKAMGDMRQRGRGERESGVFLLGPLKNLTPRVTSYICFDDLDPNAYEFGAIAFHASGLAALWRHCSEHKVRLLIDVHTHPTSDIRQSHIDVRHPTVPVVGHTAMIVPNYARAPWWSLKTVGVYEYRGSFQWRTHPPSAPDRRVKLTLW